MSISSTTTTQTTHRTTLAGGIHVSFTTSPFGASLTLSEPGRALTLSLTPEQLADLVTPAARWHSRDLVWRDADWFCATTRERLPDCDDDACGITADDDATLRALARAYQETQP